MSLSCGCPDFDPGDYEHWWIFPEDFSTYDGKRRVRCKSCRALIDVGAEHVAAPHFRHPLSDADYSIHGDEVPLAPIRFCSQCGEILLSLIEYGYCVDLSDSMPDQLREHWENTGYIPPNAAQGLSATEASA